MFVMEPFRGDVDLAVVLGISCPAGHTGITSGVYDPFIMLPWSKQLKKAWSFGGQHSLFWNTGGRTRNGLWEPTLYVEKQLSKPLAIFAEYAGDYLQRGESRQLLHVGAIYQLSKRQQLDFHFGYGLNEATPNHFFAAGYSFRLDHLWRRT